MSNFSRPSSHLKLAACRCRTPYTDFQGRGDEAKKSQERDTLQLALRINFLLEGMGCEASCHGQAEGTFYEFQSVSPGPSFPYCSGDSDRHFVPALAVSFPWAVFLCRKEVGLLAIEDFPAIGSGRVGMLLRLTRIAGDENCHCRCPSPYEVGELIFPDSDELMEPVFEKILRPASLKFEVWLEMPRRSILTQILLFDDLYGVFGVKKKKEKEKILALQCVRDIGRICWTPVAAEPRICSSGKSKEASLLLFAVD